MQKTLSVMNLTRASPPILSHRTSSLAKPPLTKMVTTARPMGIRVTTSTFPQGQTNISKTMQNTMHHQSRPIYTKHEIHRTPAPRARRGHYSTRRVDHCHGWRRAREADPSELRVARRDAGGPAGRQVYGFFAALCTVPDLKTMYLRIDGKSLTNAMLDKHALSCIKKRLDYWRWNGWNMMAEQIFRGQSSMYVDRTDKKYRILSSSQISLLGIEIVRLKHCC
ncbi:hypothetical protein K470DRAFT_40914 [Piedraia hortae CBS 480.64]|uniref:Uncharacterized protein n=1 Tax=Piedraia hortae CBS 480.64 TaxID=1314780 RepID=A0A6A7C306_9PEZI|nr:hypothetical protein K470DRAFT_40914 [Piedraia hortae CBS 480.64]